MNVCLVANTISYPEGGGHYWVYLNWAMGLRDAGCQVTCEAASFLATVAANYQRHSRAARALAEGYFDARKVDPRVLETALNQAGVVL